jgi:replicative DNA helicase
MNGREEGLIAGLIAHKGERLEKILNVITPDDFENHLNKSVFESIIELHKRNEPIDLISVTEQLESNGGRFDRENREYLVELVKEGGSFGHRSQMHFAGLIKEYSMRKKLAESAERISQLARSSTGLSIDDLTSQMDTTLTTLRLATNSKSQSYAFTSKKLVSDVLTKMQTIIKAGNIVTSGVSTGLKTVDDFTTGLHPGDFITVAGRPGMGKTTLAMGVVIKNAVIERKPTLVFSMEMPADQLYQRLVSNLSGVPFIKFRKGGFSEEDIKAIDKAIIDYDLTNAPLIIYDEGGMTLHKMRNVVLEFHRQYGLALVMIDYIQLMNGQGSGNRTEDISEISRGIKQLAKDVDCPFIVLSQLNRAVEQRMNKRPGNSDLRESGSIEQDSDLIIFLYRDEYYNPETPDKGITEIIIGKARHSETGTVRVGFVGALNKFVDLVGSSSTSSSHETKSQNVKKTTVKSTAPAPFVDDPMGELDDDSYFNDQVVVNDYTHSQDSIDDEDSDVIDLTTL